MTGDLISGPHGTHMTLNAASLVSCWVGWWVGGRFLCPPPKVVARILQENRRQSVLKRSSPDGGDSHPRFTPGGRVSWQAAVRREGD